MENMENIRYKIIMVDDNMANLSMGRNMLKTYYEVYPAPSASKLFEILESVVPDLILLDILMPEMDGYDAMNKIRQDKRLADTPVIFLTAQSDEESELKGFNLGAADYISKPFSAPLLLKRIANQLLIAQQKRDLKDYAENLEKKVYEKTGEIIKLQNSVLATVTDLVEYRDTQTGGHINRTQLYLKTLTEELVKEGPYSDEIKTWDIDIFLNSAQLHDVGKIAIPDHILNKPGKLDPDEFEIMKTHVSIGVDAIQRMMKNMEEYVFLRYALLVAGTHHEKWDGSGYPAGLKGKDIPLAGRLMAIADVYDALISVRPYKKSFTHEEACKIIKDGAGTHFDPVLVEAFMIIEKEFAKIVESMKS